MSKAVDASVRFARRVTVDLETGCHNWAGSPVIWVNGKNRSALLFACENAWADKPTRALRPACGNQRCVNPDHAEEIPYGEPGARALHSMTFETAAAIRALAAEGLKPRFIAQKLGLDAKAARSIHSVLAYNVHKRAPA